MTNRRKRIFAAVWTAILLVLTMTLTGYAKTRSAYSLIGASDEGAYVNRFFGYQLEALDGFRFQNDEELVKSGEIPADLLEDESALRKKLEAGEVYVIAYAETKNYDSINIVVGDSGKGADETDRLIDEDSLNAAKTALEDSGFKVDRISIDREYIAGKLRYVLNTKATIRDLTLYQKQVILAKNGFYLCITAASVGDDKMEQIFEKLSAVS
ncbi:MAG: hypothetical protein LIV11_09070 [Bacillota bacterium]|nr:hypothetical protein [Bacillota bacterium]